RNHQPAQRENLGIQHGASGDDPLHPTSQGEKGGETLMTSLLFVDDETKLLRILASYFTKKGFVVHTASTGEEARSKLRNADARIIFLDLKLPDATGIELLQEFVPLYPNKLFVIMTAYSDVESAVTAMKAGAFDYVSKPAKMDEMEIIIRRACE